MAWKNLALVEVAPSNEIVTNTPLLWLSPKSKVKEAAVNSDKHHTDVHEVFYKEVSKTPLLTASQEMELIKNIQRREYWIWFQLCGRKDVLKGLLNGEHELPGAFKALETLETLCRSRKQEKHFEKRARLSHELRRTDICLCLALEIFEGLSPQKGWPTQDIKVCFEEANALREKFVKANLRLVANVAQRFDNRRLGFLDKIQEGSHGLLIGLQGFDTEKGFRFSTYAHWWIRQSVERGIQNLGATIRIPVHVHDHVRSFRKARGQLVTQLGREPSLSELKKELGLSLKKVKQLKDGVPTAVLAPKDSNDEKFLGNMKSSEIAALGAPERCLVAEDNRVKIFKSLKFLKPIEREVLIRRFGLYENDEETLETVGEAVRLTRERIRQIQIEALQKVRHIFEENAWSFNV